MSTQSRCNPPPGKRFTMPNAKRMQPMREFLRPLKLIKQKDHLDQHANGARKKGTYRCIIKLLRRFRSIFPDRRINPREKLLRSFGPGRMPKAYADGLLEGRPRLRISDPRFQSPV